MNSLPTFAHTAEDAFRHSLPVETREPRLRAVLLDTLQNPGSLARLQLGLIAGDALGLPANSARAFATACEYFHTASLLFDDLPCMDDADTRRGRACAHRAHGEGAAILGALAFINRAYFLSSEALALADAATNARAIASAHIERCLGVSGVLGGQSLDLHFAETAGTPRDVARAALGKTVALLRLTLVTPALLVGTGARERCLLDQFAVYWGLAYQIADDCTDLLDGSVSKKKPARDARNRRPNFVLAAGPVAAVARLSHLMRLVEVTLVRLVTVRAAWISLRPLVERLGHAAALAGVVRSRSTLRCA